MPWLLYKLTTNSVMNALINLPCVLISKHTLAQVAQTCTTYYSLLVVWLIEAPTAFFSSCLASLWCLTSIRRRHLVSSEVLASRVAWVHMETGGCNATGAGHGADAAMTTHFRVHGRYTTLTVLEFCVSGVSIWMNLHGDPTIANAACSTSFSDVCYRPRYGCPKLHTR